MMPASAARRDAWPTAFRLLRVGWKKRFDHRPEVIGYESIHARPTHLPRFCPALSVGSAVPVLGTLLGAAVGAIIGILVCSRDVISKPIGDKLDFSLAIDQTAANTGMQTRMIDAMIERKIAPDQQAAAVMLRYVLIEARKQPDRFYRSSTSVATPTTGRTARGLADLARKSRAAVATVAS